MSFAQKVKSILWMIVDAMSCNVALFAKIPKRILRATENWGLYSSSVSASAWRAAASEELSPS